MKAGVALVAALGFINIGFLLATFFDRSLMSQRGGKILLLLACLILPVVVALMTLHTNLEDSKQVSFCLSCHVMEPYGESLLADDPDMVPAVHYQNNLVRKNQACYECHTDYTMFGTVSAKIRGLQHMYVHYLKGPPKKLELYVAYDNRECLRCHAGARSFEEKEDHTEDGQMKKIMSGKRSCVSGGCHEDVHNIGDDGKGEEED